jgi:hypothetical protein
VDLASGENTNRNILGLAPLKHRENVYHRVSLVRDKLRPIKSSRTSESIFNVKFPISFQNTNIEDQELR